jgi:hypothetical protein
VGKNFKAVAEKKLLKKKLFLAQFSKFILAQIQKVILTNFSTSLVKLFLTFNFLVKKYF